MNSAIATHESPGPILSAAALPGGFTGPSLSQEERSLIVRLRKGDEGAFDHRFPIFSEAVTVAGGTPLPSRIVLSPSQIR